MNLVRRYGNPLVHIQYECRSIFSMLPTKAIFKMVVFWDVLSCNLGDADRRFRSVLPDHPDVSTKQITRSKTAEDRHLRALRRGNLKSRQEGYLFIIISAMTQKKVLRIL